MFRELILSHYRFGSVKVRNMPLPGRPLESERVDSWNPCHILPAFFFMPCSVLLPRIFVINET